MQQKWLTSVLIVLVVALASFAVGRYWDSITGYSVSSKVVLSASPAEVKEGSKVVFTVEPNGEKYYSAVNIFEKEQKRFIANVDVKTASGSCNVCNDKGTAEFSTIGKAPGDYYAQVLPVGEKKKPVEVDFTIIEKQDWE